MWLQWLVQIMVYNYKHNSRMIDSLGRELGRDYVCMYTNKVMKELLNLTLCVMCNSRNMGSACREAVDPSMLAESIICDEAELREIFTVSSTQQERPDMLIVKTPSTTVIFERKRGRGESRSRFEAQISGVIQTLRDYRNEMWSPCTFTVYVSKSLPRTLRRGALDFVMVSADREYMEYPVIYVDEESMTRGLARYIIGPEEIIRLLKKL